MRKSRIWESRK